MVLVVISTLLLSFNINAAIGSVTEQKGIASITRNKSSIEVKKNVGVDSNDLVQTGNGVVGISFEDNTQVRVTENSKLVIDDFVYDPKNKSAGKLGLKVAMGTVRYASGNIAHNNPSKVAINTPTATIAVRGTAFSMTVDEIGQSMIILLPNKDGSVGEIEVQTAMGSVVLNQAFQATMTTSNETRPLRPVLLMLNESAINNMLIVRPPKEITQRAIENINKSGSALEFNALDQNALDVKVFKDIFAEFNELGINELDVNLLTNALDNYMLAAFTVGYNAITQIYIFDKSTYWQVTRNVKQNFTALVNKDRGYMINLTQDAYTIQLQNQDSTTNTLTVKQIGK